MKWSVLTAWVLVIAMALVIGSDTAVAQNIQKRRIAEKGRNKCNP